MAGATGRPSIFDQSVFDVICDRLAQGQSLREVCRTEGMPDPATVRTWVAENKEGVSPQYARAREAGAERWADEILEIADDGSNDWMERRKADGSIEAALDREHIDRSKQRVDARKWLLSKMLPKKYGDKTTIDHGGTVRNLNVNTTDPVEAARVYRDMMNGDGGE